MSKKRKYTKSAQTPSSAVSVKSASEASESFNFDGMFGAKQQAWFSAMSKIIFKNLNNNTKTESFFQYTKDQIATYIKNPAQNENELRNAVVHLYNASSHFRRLIQYFVGLNDAEYVIAPIAIDYDADVQKVRENYLKTATLLAGANLKTQLQEIKTVCFREDTYFCTSWVTKDTITFQKLDPSYCKIASREGNVFNVNFDFSYFDQYAEELEMYPTEFQTKYNQYTNDSANKWIELDSPTSFAIKCNTDFPTYSVPPFVGVLRELYDLEDYKSLKMSKTELENYCMLVMQLGLNSVGEWTMDFEKAKEFWQNLDSVLPPQIGSVLSPMPINKIAFDSSGTAESDKITESETHLWGAAGVSSQIFSASNTSSRSLEMSIMSDQALTWGVVQDVGVAINRILQKQSFSKGFALMFLDISRYNRAEYIKMLSGTIQYGFPSASMLMSAIGAEPLHTIGLNYLEQVVLELPKKFVPLKSANTASASSADVGAPERDGSEMADETEVSREKK